MKTHDRVLAKRKLPAKLVQPELSCLRCMLPFPPGERRLPQLLIPAYCHCVYPITTPAEHCTPEVRKAALAREFEQIMARARADFRAGAL